jgi:triacylglycerol lipase
MERLPIVLAHGIFRFDILRLLVKNETGIDLGPHYFRGMVDHLRAKGLDATESDVSFCGTVERRSQQLKKHVISVLERASAPKVHIIAHSMGGLDARKMIVDEGMASHVASVTTIGTPHQGTVSADLGLKLGGALVLSAVRPVIDFEGFKDLTTDACGAFNRRVRDAEVHNEVRYRVVVASEVVERTNPLLQATSLIIRRAQGDNDGIVARTSQDWDARLIASDGRQKRVERMDFPVPADHLNEIGHWDIGEELFGMNKTAYEARVRDFYLALALSA